MLTLPDLGSLTRGIIVLGLPGEDAQKITDALANQFKAKIYRFASEKGSLDANVLLKFYDIYKLPEGQRTYSVVHIDQENMADYSESISSLILESRPLRLIFIVEISNLSKLSTSQKNALFGTMPNFIIGNLPPTDLEYFNKLTNNLLTKEDSNSSLRESSVLFSTLDPQNNRQNTPLSI